MNGDLLLGSMFTFTAVQMHKNKVMIQLNISERVPRPVGPATQAGSNWEWFVGGIVMLIWTARLSCDRNEGAASDSRTKGRSENNSVPAYILPGCRCAMVLDLENGLVDAWVGGGSIAAYLVMAEIRVNNSQEEDIREV